jgi:hypothetical protein
MRHPLTDLEFQNIMLPNLDGGMDEVCCEEAAISYEQDLTPDQRLQLVKKYSPKEIVQYIYSTLYNYNIAPLKDSK